MGQGLGLGGQGVGFSWVSESSGWRRGEEQEREGMRRGERDGRIGAGGGYARTERILILVPSVYSRMNRGGLNLMA
jgi:hypothetical protein